MTFLVRTPGAVAPASWSRAGRAPARRPADHRTSTGVVKIAAAGHDSPSWTQKVGISGMIRCWAPITRIHDPNSRSPSVPASPAPSSMTKSHQQLTLGGRQLPAASARQPCAPPAVSDPPAVSPPAVPRPPSATRRQPSAASREPPRRDEAEPPPTSRRRDLGRAPNANRSKQAGQPTLITRSGNPPTGIG